MSGMIGVEVETIVEKLRGISFMQPLYEAVTNSLEAGATEITVHLCAGGQPEGTRESGIIGYINGYTIVDNGKGFDEKNLQSFNTYMSKEKAKLGCKGIGRFTWLAVFNSIHIQSYTGTKEINIDFNLNYNNTKPTVSDVVHAQETTITMRDSTRDIKHREKAVLEDIYTSIMDHLFIKMHLMATDNKIFKINLLMGNENIVIDSKQLPKLEKIPFIVQKEDNRHEFVFYHYVHEPYKAKKLDLYYCAHGRTVKAVSSEILNKKMFDKKVRFVGLVCSEYLDDSVTDDRMNFSFSRTDIQQKDIEEDLRNVLNTVLVKYFPELANENIQVIKDCINDYPHLAEWIEKDDSPIKQKTYIIAKAKKEHDNKKEKTRANFNKMLASAEITTEDFTSAVEQVSYVQSLELAEYIYYREKIINGLKTLQERNAPIESYLHNIFMKMRTTATNGLINPYSSNIWLFDDKFMSYSYIASDTTLKRIKEEIDSSYNEKHNRISPDIFLIVLSKSEEYLRDAVVIEFKGLGATRAEKMRSIGELPTNMFVIKEKLENINQVWGYIVTSLDDDLEVALKANDYESQFVAGSSCKMYHKYIKNSEAHVYVLDVNTVIGDAEARNNVFLNILKSKHNFGD